MDLFDRRLAYLGEYENSWKGMSMKAALFVGWGSIIPGREKTAARVLGEAMQYLTALKVQGRLDSIDVVLLEPHGGDLEGFVLVRGEREHLAAMRGEQEFLSVIVAVQLVHSKVGVAGAYAGAEMQSLMHLWDEQEERLLSDAAGGLPPAESA